MEKYIDGYADRLIEQIYACINQKLKNQPQVRGAIVQSVNSDGSANVTVPPNTTTIFTNISNQTPFVLQAGDSVELMLPRGSYSSCWITAVHGKSFLAGTTE